MMIPLHKSSPRSIFPGGQVQPGAILTESTQLIQFDELKEHVRQGNEHSW